MNPVPTGRLDGAELVLTPTFRASMDDVWRSIVEPERTKRWFAEWWGEPGPGRTIKYRMVFEGDDAPASEMLIERCEPPSLLLVSSVEEHGTMRLEARLVERAGATELTLIQHLDDLDAVGEMGPGWEYYLDLLVSSREGTPQPSFDDYYPGQKPYYENLRAPA